MRLLRAYEKKYLPRVLKALEGEADRFIKEAERVGFESAFRTFGLVNERLLTVVNQLHKEVGVKFGKEMNRQLTKTEKISFFNANFILNLIEILTRQALDLLTAVETTTKERILNILTRSQTEQLTFTDTAKLITEQVASPERALTITRTESNRAANIAAFEAAKLKPFQVTKEWISAIDNRTRRYREKDEYDHAILDGSVQELDTAFTQIGRTKGIQALAQYPLDAQAPAAFTINCRCVLGFEYKRDENGELIPKGVIQTKPTLQRQTIINDSQNINTINNLEGQIIEKTKIIQDIINNTRNGIEGIDALDIEVLNGILSAIKKEKYFKFENITYKNDRLSIMSSSKNYNLTIGSNAQKNEMLVSIGTQLVSENRKNYSAAAKILQKRNVKDDFLIEAYSELITNHELNHIKHFSVEYAALGGWGNEIEKRAKKWLKNWDQYIANYDDDWTPSDYSASINDKKRRSYEWLAESYLLYENDKSLIKNGKIISLLDEFDMILKNMRNAK